MIKFETLFRPSFFFRKTEDKNEAHIERKLQTKCEIKLFLLLPESLQKLCSFSLQRLRNFFSTYSSALLTCGYGHANSTARLNKSIYADRIKK